MMTLEAAIKKNKWIRMKREKTILRLIHFYIPYPPISALDTTFSSRQSSTRPWISITDGFQRRLLQRLLRIWTILQIYSGFRLLNYHILFLRYFQDYTNIYFKDSSRSQKLALSSCHFFFMRTDLITNVSSLIQS